MDRVSTNLQLILGMGLFVALVAVALLGGLLLATFAWRRCCPSCSERTLLLKYIGYIRGERTSYYDCRNCGRRDKYTGSGERDPTEHEWRLYCRQGE
jgi:hypothetical protein